MEFTPFSLFGPSFFPRLSGVGAVQDRCQLFRVAEGSDANGSELPVSSAPAENPSIRLRDGNDDLFVWTKPLDLLRLRCRIRVK